MPILPLNAQEKYEIIRKKDMEGYPVTNIDPKWGSWAERPAPVKPGDIVRTEETEVLVVGAGIAGMSCVLSAAEAGAKVTVLEKTGYYAARGFNIGVVNSSLMRERGYYNDPDEVAREWIKRCGNRCDERVVRKYVTRSPEAMDWLLDIITRPEYGVRPELQGCLYKGETYRELIGSHIFYDGPISRAGKIGGMTDVVECMYVESQKYDVKYLFNTPMEQLIVEDGRVVGVYGRSEEGLIAVRASKGVVLATGGIDGNDEMCADLCPIANKTAEKLYWPKGGNLGDGHRAALWAGADFEDLPFPAMLHPQAYRHPSWCFLFVNPSGHRYMNEDNYLQARSLGVIKEGVKYCWSIFDSDWREKVPATLPYGGGLFWGNDYAIGRSTEFQLAGEEAKLEQGLKGGYAFAADTPEELAGKMEVDPAVFAETFTRYNAMCAAGKDEDFGKRPELLIPLDKPPYYAKKIAVALLAVVGGVRVDAESRALTPEHKPVPGLYALGNTAGGRYGVDYPLMIPGNSHGTALTFGYLLGRALAK